MSKINFDLFLIQDGHGKSILRDERNEWIIKNMTDSSFSQYRIRNGIFFYFLLFTFYFLLFTFYFLLFTFDYKSNRVIKERKR